MKASEWAQRKAESISAAREASSVEAALKLERLNIRKANFPDLVQSVHDAFSAYCEEYNKRRPAGDKSLHYIAMSGTLSLLKRDAGFSEIHVRVNFAARTMRVTAHNCSFQYDHLYRPEATDDGGALFLCSGNGCLITPDDVAQMAMDAFLDGHEMAMRL